MFYILVILCLSDCQKPKTLLRFQGRFYDPLVGAVDGLEAPCHVRN